MSDTNTPPAQGYGEFTGVGTTDQITPWEQARAELSNLVTEAQAAEKEIAEAEEKVKAAKKKHQDIVQGTLPTLMRKYGVFEQGFTTTSGLIVKGKSSITTSVPAPRRNEAWDWLEEHGYSDILKREVTIAFAVNEDKLAKEAAEALQTIYNRTVSCERWAEPATLKKTISDILEDNKAKAAAGEAIVEVPKDLFGIREVDQADIKLPKTT